MKILIDMNLSPRWCDLLNGSGFTTVHWSTIGAGDATDRQIVSYAARQGFVVLTHDLDFGSILAATGGRQPSVVQIRAGDVSPAKIGSQVVAALRQMNSELGSGALLTIEPDRARLRLLPLLNPATSEGENE